jgi:cystathionine beta-lyase
MDRHVENAKAVADFLKTHDGVIKIYYPGLEDFVGYEVNKKQARAAGAMISFVLSDNYDIKEFFKNVDLITLGESLGGVESLISHPASMTHLTVKLIMLLQVLAAVVQFQELCVT